MPKPLVDISGRAIPTRQDKSLLERTIAVPPVRDVPNEQSQEFLMSAFALLPLGGAAFVQLTDPTTGNPFAPQVSALYKGRIDQIMIFCPDMVIAAAPYLFVRMTIGNQLANAWGFVPVWPRAGICSLAFDTWVDLGPDQIITLAGENTDAANNHFLGVYLHGWFWPKDIVES